MPLDPTTWWLILTVVMPGQIPDIRYPIQEPSQTACEADLHEFLLWAKLPTQAVVINGTPYRAQTKMAACIAPKGDADLDAKSTNYPSSFAG